jgi:exo-beta-1,3-glucanase (GH17 family)
MTRLPHLAVLVLTALGCGPVRAEPLCHRSGASAAALAPLHAALAQARFITYQPTALQVINGQAHAADPASIRADLAALRPHFDALITYDAVHGAEAIPALAAALHFRALIIGVWNPFDPAEVDAALKAAREYPRLVLGVSLGNEMLFSHRATESALTARLAALHAAAPRLALSTSEPFHLFEQPQTAALRAELDFLLPIVHPLFQPWYAGSTARTGAQFVVNVAGDLTRDYCGPLLIKESGEPTAPAERGYSPARQAAFWAALRELLPPTGERAFAYFAAFDAPWRAGDATGVPGPHPEEAFWGLFDAARRPKSAVDQLPPLPQDPGH